MKRKLIYASDLDRTLIYSRRFIDEHPTDAAYSVVETKDGTIISYMSNAVKHELEDINRNEDVEFIPVTTRSIAEYERVQLGFIPEYAIVSNGGTILYKGEPMAEWESYIQRQMNLTEVISIKMDIEDMCSSVDYEPRLIDGKYLFFKTDDGLLFDQEIERVKEEHPEWTFVRQSRKCYVIPNHFSKQIALRWLYLKLGKPYIVASGDSELDLGMLSLANKAIIPNHGALVIEGIVEDGRIIDGGINSPLKTISIVKESLDELESE